MDLRVKDYNIKNGDIYNKWTVISELYFKKHKDGRNRAIFDVRCECGCSRSISPIKIISGRPKSCHKCHRRFIREAKLNKIKVTKFDKKIYDKYKIKIGDVFNQWKVTSEPYFHKYYGVNESVVDIVCNCGTKTRLRLYKLVTGKSKQCLKCCGKSKRKHPIINGYKICCTCNISKQIEFFKQGNKYTDGVNTLCKSCERYRNAEKNYGLLKEEFDALFLKFNGKCGICEKDLDFDYMGKSKEKRINIDHCHTTEKVRGVLCSGCNLGIGCLNDDIEILNKAIQYLKENG